MDGVGGRVSHVTPGVEALQHRDDSVGGLRSRRDAADTELRGKRLDQRASFPWCAATPLRARPIAPASASATRQVFLAVKHSTQTGDRPRMHHEGLAHPPRDLRAVRGVVREFVHRERRDQVGLDDENIRQVASRRLVDQGEMREKCEQPVLGGAPPVCSAGTL
eukprot:6522279-Prymnesium_polylepis.3